MIAIIIKQNKKRFNKIKKKKNTHTHTHTQAFTCRSTAWHSSSSQNRWTFMFRNFNTNINLKIKRIFRLFYSLSKSTNMLFILKFSFLFLTSDQTVTNGRKTHFYGGISTAIEDLTGLNKLDRSHFSIHTGFVCGITLKKHTHTLSHSFKFFS